MAMRRGIQSYVTDIVQLEPKFVQAVTGAVVVFARLARKRG